MSNAVRSKSCQRQGVAARYDGFT